MNDLLSKADIEKLLENFIKASEIFQEKANSMWDVMQYAEFLKQVNSISTTEIYKDGEEEGGLGI